MKRIVASIGAIGLALLLSCGDGGEEGEAKQNGVLYADVWNYGSPDSIGAEAVLYSDVMVDISDLTLRINGTELEKDEWGGGPYPDFVFFGYVPKTDPSNLSFTSSVLGNASASVKIPGPTSITNPADDDTLPAGQDVNVAWNTTTCDFYWFDVDIDIYDGSGSWLDSRYWSGYTTSASYTIPKDSLSYPGMAYAEVEFEVSPVMGPVPAPGTKGNITGDIEGFFYGVDQGDEVDFYVGTPVKLGKKRPHEPFDSKAFLKGVAEIIGR